MSFFTWIEGIYRGAFSGFMYSFVFFSQASGFLIVWLQISFDYATPYIFIACLIRYYFIGFTHIFTPFTLPGVCQAGPIFIIWCFSRHRPFDFAWDALFTPRLYLRRLALISIRYCVSLYFLRDIALPFRHIT